MRAAAVFGFGTRPEQLNPFRGNPVTEWIEGVPATAADADAVLIFGGDGTIHRHLPALVRLGLPTLIVPSGSGNDFARALRLRSANDSLRAWRRFAEYRSGVRAIDLGTIATPLEPGHPRYFCCVADCGLDAIVTKRANRMPRWLRGHGGYVLAFLPWLFKLPAFKMRLTQIAGEKRETTEQPTLLAAFANTQYYGDGMRIAPDADFADGQLDVCQITAINPMKLFCLFPTVYFGRHTGANEVHCSKAERVCLETETPLDVYADGEFVCQTPVEIGVAAGALKVITP